MPRRSHSQSNPISHDDAREIIDGLEWLRPLDWQHHALTGFDRFPKARVFSMPCCRQAGKTEIARRMIVEGSSHSTPGDTDLYIAPTYVDGRRPWRLTERLVRQHPELGDVLRAERTIAWSWGSVTQFRHGGPGDIVGETINTLCVVDEAGKINDELHEYLDPMFKRYDAYKINVGSPRGINRFHEDFLLGLDEDGNSPLVTGKDPINPLYISLRVRHHDIPWHTPEAIAEAQRRMSPQLFAQEYEAEFLSGANEAFPGVTSLHVLEVEEPDQYASYSIGYDPARKVDAAAVSVLRTDCTPPREVFHWRSPLGLEWGRQFDIIANIVTRYPGIITLDATGLGDVVLSALRSKGLAVDPIVINETARQQMAEDMVTLVSTEGIQFLKEDANEHTKAAYDEMRDWQVEIKEGTGSVVSASNLRYGHMQGRHDDSVFARLLAAMCLRRIMTHVPVA